MLPVKKIYIDSRYKTADSASNSDFKMQLNRSIHLPKNTVFYIENFACAHVWYSIEENINDTLYMVINGSNHYFTLTSKNYTGDTFATEIQSKLNGIQANTFTVTFDSTRNNITIGVVNSTTFKVLTSTDLTKIFGNVDPKSTNDVLQNVSYPSPVYSNSNPFVSGFLNLLCIRNLYLHSPNLSSFTTYGGNGESNIIKKIPVTSDFGYIIVDNFTSTHDWLDCSGMTINNVEFQLRDVRGNLVPLHDSNVSFSIVFSKMDLEDY